MACQGNIVGMITGRFVARPDYRHLSGRSRGLEWVQCTVARRDGSCSSTKLCGTPFALYLWTSRVPRGRELGCSITPEAVSEQLLGSV